MTGKPGVSSRERVLMALRHEPPDRTPRDFWAEEPTWNRLLAHTTHSGREELLRHLEIDIRHLDVPTPPELALGGGIYQNFWGERYTYQSTPWGPMREDVKGALAAAQSSAELESFPWPSADEIDHSALRRKCQEYEEYALIYGFADVWQRPALVRGWEGMFVDMVERPDWVHFLCRRFTDYYLADYTRAAEVTRGRIDLYLLISDLGGQKGPLISMAMFRRFVAPYLKEMIDRIHHLGARVLYHSCGMIQPFIPELIQLGIDVLDPLQPTSPAMAPERLKAEFGERLCFHGGIDIQQLLPYAKVEEIHQEVRRYCEVLGRGGGYILGPTHLFQPDTPPENVLVVYEAA
jgi:uroporphyrinogen decarboxylase